MRTFLFLIFNFIAYQIVAQNYQLVPDSCTICVYRSSDGKGSWYTNSYSVLGNRDTTYNGNTYVMSEGECCLLQPFGIRQVGNKLYGAVNDSLQEFLIMDFDAEIGDSIDSLYSEGFYYMAKVENKDSVLLNNGIYHHYMELQGIGYYDNGGFYEAFWNLQWNERALCRFINSAGTYGGVYFNIIYFLYSISVTYDSPKFCTTDEIYENPQGVTCVMCNPQTSNLEGLDNQQFEVYPNPTSTKLTVKSKTVIHEISISDLNGKSVEQFNNLNANQYVINTDELSRGIYVLSIKTSMGYYTQKLIKN